MVARVVAVECQRAYVGRPGLVRSRHRRLAPESTPLQGLQSVDSARPDSIACHFDTKATKSIVAVRPKPPFKPIFQVAAAREGSGIRIINEPPSVGSSVFVVEAGERQPLAETTFRSLLAWLPAAVLDTIGRQRRRLALTFSSPSSRAVRGCQASDDGSRYS